MRHSQIACVLGGVLLFLLWDNSLAVFAQTRKPSQICTLKEQIGLNCFYRCPDGTEPLRTRPNYQKPCPRTITTEQKGMEVPAKADTPEISVFIDSSFRVEECGEGCWDHTHKFSTTIKGKKFEWEGKTRGNCARCWYKTNGSGSCPVSCDDLKRGEKVQCKVKTLYGEQTITLSPGPIEEYRHAFCTECDESLWAEYERKKQVAEDLFKAAAKLREEIVVEGQEFYREQMIGMGEVSAVKGPPVYMAEKLKHDGLKAMAQTRGGLADKAAYLRGSRIGGTVVVTAEYAGIAGTALWVYMVGEKIRQLDAEWDESQKMAAQASRLLEEATVAFRAYTDQLQACTQAQEKLRAAEELADRARVLMETWESNGYLYRDPSGQILDSSAAFKRAKEILSRSSSHNDRPSFGIRPVSEAVAAEPGSIEIKVTLDQVGAALAAVEQGVDLYSVGMDHVVQMHRAQENSDASLQAFLKQW